MEELNKSLTSHNVSFEQAKLKAIWRNPLVTSICSLMPNKEVLRANVMAATDVHPLNRDISRLLADYAQSTGKYFCRRCGACETVNNDIPIFKIIELLMYSRGYGKIDLAAQIFFQLPVGIQRKIVTSDYSRAEKICPQKMPISQLMKEAYIEFQ